MTLQPPTFEILSMCSGVLLMSGGRVIFSGSRSDLPRVMGSLGYPVPPHRQPSDYYGKFFCSNFCLMNLVKKIILKIILMYTQNLVDLVTLDDLSAAALLESSSRIEALANAWDRINSEPPLAAPKASLPPPTRRAGMFGQIVALSKRQFH